MQSRVTPHDSTRVYFLSLMDRDLDLCRLCALHNIAENEFFAASFLRWAIDVCCSIDTTTERNISVSGAATGFRVYRDRERLAELAVELS